MEDTVQFVFNDLIYGQMLNIHQIIGFLALVVGMFGMYIALKLPRPIVYKVKLSTVYAIPIVTGICAMIMPVEEFNLVQHTLNVAFMIMATILYWREVAKYIRKSR